MPTAVLTPPIALSTPFPTTAVSKALLDELMEAVKAEASVKGLTLPAADTDIAKESVGIDSLVVVAILCTVEPIVGFELPESVVRTGGYTSVEAALGHLVPRIEAQWIKKNGAKP